MPSRLLSTFQRMFFTTLYKILLSKAQIVGLFVFIWSLHRMFHIYYFGILKGWASVLKVKSSKLITSGSLKIR